MPPRTAHFWHTTGSSSRETLDPYVVFIGAFFQRVLLDAQGITGQGLGKKGILHPHVQQARDFLADQSAVGYWTALLGADAEKILPTITQVRRKGENPIQRPARQEARVTQAK